MVDTTAKPDWVGNTRADLLAWGVPHAAVILALFFDVPVRAAVWVVALAWMGTACLLNARRCGRTHCRFTGPFYLAMILPVGALGLGIAAIGFPAWLALAAFILLGSKIIWWATERTWGKFS